MNMTYMSVKKEQTNTYNNMGKYRWNFVDWNKFDKKSMFFFLFHLYEVQEKPMVRNQYYCYLWGEVRGQMTEKGHKGTF